MATDASSGAAIVQLFSGLVELTPEMDVVPDVARTWEVLEGGRKYVFHLRNDERWSDGVPVTAGDFEYAWKRLLDPATGSPAASLLYDIKGARAFHRGEGETGGCGGARPGRGHPGGGTGRTNGVLASPADRLVHLSPAPACGGNARQSLDGGGEPCHQRSFQARVLAAGAVDGPVAQPRVSWPIPGEYTAGGIVLDLSIHWRPMRPVAWTSSSEYHCRR